MNILEAGGEGVILRPINSFIGNTIYKVKDILSFQLIVTRIVDHKNGWFF